MGRPGVEAPIPRCPDAVVLAAFAAMKSQSDPFIVALGAIGMALVLLFVLLFLARNSVGEGAHDHH